ncbi:MAG TPA: sulfatase-like hydrolase/transferase [Tepidisphaeraceae bacterium]
MDLAISRRQFVQATAASMLAAPLLGAEGAAGQRKPNVILIMLDDLGSIDANCYGAKDLVTPNIDALAAEGVRFTDFHSAAPLCSPSRTAVLTGRYPTRAGLESNASSEHGKGPAMAPDEVTLAQVLKNAGYATGHVGKWHVGYTEETMPLAKGFDSSFGHMGGCIDNYSHFFYWQGPNRHDLWQDGNETWRDGQNIGDLMVDACGRFLDANKDKPFFLFWAINQPHYPLQGKPKWREHYKDLPSPRSMYAASVSTLDELIGQVMAKVRALGLADDTIVILQSDHGHSTEERAFFGGGNAGPYRGAKFSMFEGGHRVVSMISHSRALPRGVVREQFVTGCDWLPTICELTGAAPPNRRLDGKSMLPILRSEAAPSQHPWFHWQLGKQWAVREGDWKLIGNPVDSSHKAPITPADKLFLSNLSRDVSEMTNLAHENPEAVARLSSLHEKWLADVKDRS